MSLIRLRGKKKSKRLKNQRRSVMFVTSPPTHSVGGKLVTVAGVCRRLSSSFVTHYGGLAGGFTRAGQVMTLCRLQSDYSSTVTLHGGPVVLRPVRATPCFGAIVKHLLTLTS